MDVISGLPDDLLLKILSFLPTKVAVSTSLLSKRWEFLWMWLPKLDYVTSSLFEYRRLRCFLNKTLPLHRAPIKSFRLVTYPFCKPEDVKSWFVVAVSRHLRRLGILHKAFCGKELPSSLFACKSLVILKLCGYILLNVPRKAYLPSLKTLQLQKVTGVDGESLQRLLFVCPVLKNLSVNSCYGSGNISVIIPSLQRLSIYNVDDADRIKIDSPSLTYLKLKVFNEENYDISVGNMPKLEEAYVDVNVNDIDSLMGSITTSVKRLTLCCSSAVYSSNFVFNQLEHLKLCDCTASLMNLLARLLKDSPNLRVLDIFHMGAHANSYMVGWNEPSNVPECFLSTLQTFNWSGYLGRPQDKNIVVYILKNACRLRTVTISSGELALTEKFQMIKELSNSPRASTTCQLIFD